MEIDDQFFQNFLPYYEEYIANYREEIIQKIFEIIKKAYFNKKDILEYLECLINIPEIREKINNRPEYVIACCTDKNVTYVLKFLKDINRIKEIRERKFGAVKSDELIDDTIISKLVNIDVSDLRKEKILPFLKQLLNEVLEIEKLNIGDIEYLAQGTTSTVYRVGNVVFKFGKDRRTPKYKGHPNILRPILRMAIPKIENEQTVEDTYLDKDKLMFIEIQPYIGRDKSLPRSYNTIDKLYKKLQSDGIDWRDVEEENIALINFDNEINYGGINYVAPEAIGIASDDEGITPYIENGGTPVVIDGDGFRE